MKQISDKISILEYLGVPKHDMKVIINVCRGCSKNVKLTRLKKRALRGHVLWSLEPLAGREGHQRKSPALISPYE